MIPSIGSFFPLMYHLYIAFLGGYMLSTTDYGNIETTIDPVAEIIQTKTDIEWYWYNRTTSGDWLIQFSASATYIFERIHPMADLPILVGWSVQFRNQSFSSWWFQAVWGKYQSNWMISPGIGANKNVSNHHLKPCFLANLPLRQDAIVANEGWFLGFRSLMSCNCNIMS